MPKRKKITDENKNPSGRLGEFGSAIMQIAEEKGIPKNVVIETIEAALAAAIKKITASADKESGLNSMKFQERLSFF